MTALVMRSMNVGMWTCDMVLQGTGVDTNAAACPVYRLLLAQPRTLNGARVLVLVEGVIDAFNLHLTVAAVVKDCPM